MIALIAGVFTVFAVALIIAAVLPLGIIGYHDAKFRGPK